MGYSRFEHLSHGIALELTMLVPLEDPIKICRLRVRNDSPRRRSISITAYVEWVLGPSRTAGAPHVFTEQDAGTGALFARNPWNTEFPGVAFADLRGAQTEFTCDRGEFLGRHGTLDAPGGAGIGCAACRVAPAPGSTPARRCARGSSSSPARPPKSSFLLGEAAGNDEARALIATYRGADIDKLLGEVREHWDEVHGPRAGEDARPRVRHHDERLAAVPDAGLPHLGARGVSTRRAARTASATSSRTPWRWGCARPQLLREQILRAASRQFPEGDVQHWWLPHSGQGVRTHISDDRVWLSFVTAHYVALTGDRAILDEQVPFIEGPPLPRERHDAFFEPAIGEHTATLFEHCRLGLEGALYMGQHGLPLIGTGDWNDGMNRVGEHGRGESVWLGWFLHATLHAFAPHRAGARRTRARHRVARARHEAARRARAARLGWRVVSPRLLRRRHAARLGRTTTNARSTPSRSPGA